jgi:preprotein translocase subunit SecF
VSFNPRKFDYVKHRKIYFAITIALVIIWVLLLSFRGLHLGIDFSQGTRVEISSKNQNKEADVRSVIEESGIDAAEIDGIQFAQGGKIANLTFGGEFSQDLTWDRHLCLVPIPTVIRDCDSACTIA